MAELHSYYPSSPSDKRNNASKSGKYISYKGKGMKSRRACRPLLLRRPLPAGSDSSTARCLAGLAPPVILSGNFLSFVAARKSITARLHYSMESSSETFACRHLPALHPVAFPTSFQTVICWSFHWRQWWKRCSSIWAILVPPPHHQHLLSSRCPNCFSFMPTGACPDFSR
jgi:hypothetical protein